MKVSIPDALHICPGCEQTPVSAGIELCSGCSSIENLLVICARQHRTDLDHTRAELRKAEQELARARRNTRCAIRCLIVGPALAALSILVLPYLFRAVLFVERTMGVGR
jgi:hypothetical protein